MPNIGLSFSPTQSAQGSGGGQGQQMQRQSSSPVMDAIKILSFRVPQTLGANAPTGAPLLAGMGGATPGMGGGGGNDQAALFQQWLQRFFGQGLGNAQAPAFSSQQYQGDSGGSAPAAPSAYGTPTIQYSEGGAPSGPPPPSLAPSAPTSPEPNPFPTDTVPSWGGGMGQDYQNVLS